MRSWFLLPLLHLSCLAPSLRADDKYILGKDDTDFALELDRAGFGDLAQEICKAIENIAGGDPEKRAAAELLRINLQVGEVQRERDPKKRVWRLLDIVKAKEEFGDRNKGTKLGDEVVATLPDLYRVVGESVAAAIQIEEDPAQSAKLRTEGTELFKRSERALNQKLSELENQAATGAKEELTIDDLLNDEASGDSTDPNERIKAQTLYSLFRTYYFHAILLEPADADRAMLFERSLKSFQEFQFDFGSDLRCYEGFVYEGLCHDGLGKSAEAIGSFDSAIRVRENFDKGGGGVWQLPKEVADVVSWAVVQKMLVLSKGGDEKGAIAAADDFLAATPDPFTTMKGLAVLANKADACARLGDQPGLESAAKKLIEVDPRGAGGEKGRSLLGLGTSGSGKGLGLTEMLRAAEQAIGNGELDKAIAAGQRVLSNSRGTKEAVNAGAQAALLIGIACVQRDQLYEAVAAWEGGIERFPTAEIAPELLWRLSNGWIGLYSKDQRKYYKDRWRIALEALLTKYPKSPQAQQGALSDAKTLDAEQKYLEAAAAYDKISPTSLAYGEALYRAGSSLTSHVRDQLQKNKKADVKAVVADAETRLKKAREVLEKAAKDTLDMNAQARFSGLAYASRVSLAGLYLLVDRAAEVLTMLEKVETEYAGDTEKITAAWGLRIRAYQDLGKIDEAMKQLDAQIAKDPKARNVAAAASAVGRAIDARAVEQLKEKGASPALDAQFQRAIKYYLLGIAPQVEGREALRVDAVEAVADRLFALGFQLNGVPETVTTFSEWTGKRKETAAWTEAVRLYKVIVPLTPSYRTLIHLAQAQAFLGAFNDSASSYAELFTRERFLVVADNGEKRIDEESMRAKPELLSAYIEYGMTLRESGLASREEQERAASLERASSVFEVIVTSTARDTKTWWQSKYAQVQLLSDRGDYKTAQIAIRSLQRSSDGFDGGRFGVKPKFEALEALIASKLPPEPGQPAPKPPAGGGK